MIEIQEYFTIPEFYEDDFNNILYVDDEESNLRVFDSVFSRYYNIYTANNGNTAIEMLRNHEIHMIITDQKMPEMTGTDLLEKTLDEFPDIIRIILTGFADIQAIIKAINKCSIYKYITKPYENSEVKQIIEKGLEIYNMRQEKYKSSNSSQNSGDNSGDEALEEASSSGSKALTLSMANDVKLNSDDFDAYFDFHINYEMPKQAFSSLYSDFIVNTDEESSQLFYAVINTSNDEKGALSYLHFKSNFRSMVLGQDNDVNLASLAGALKTFYLENGDESFHFELKLFTYNWDSGNVQFYSNSDCMKIYSISEQLEPLPLKASKSSKDGYKVFKASSKEDLMIYFWDYSLSAEGSEEAGGYFRQIVQHVTNVPFDLQASQVASGIKSVSKYFSDAVLFGLYIND